MPRSYLSASEKEQLLKLSVLIVEIEEIIERWAATGKRKGMVKWLRTAHTYINKAFGERTKVLDPKEAAQLFKQARSQEVVFMTTLEAKRERKKIQEEIGTQILPWDDFKHLAAHALASCSVCESTGDEVDECPFRAVMMAQDIEALTLEPDPGECQYRIKAGGGSNE